MVYPTLSRYAEFIYEQAPTKSCHSSSLAQTPEGLVATWFGGTHEGHGDVGIWISRRIDGTWTEPVEVADGIQRDGRRYPCWNPVLFYDQAAGLMLFYKVGPSPKKWWGELMTSPDNGNTWSPARRLPESILGPIKNKPVRLSNGQLLCPSSTEHDGWNVHLEMTADGGETWKFIGPVPGGPRLRAIQPSVLLHPSERLQILCRSKNNRILESWSDDGGLTWSPLKPTSLPNPNSGTDAVTLKDGRHALVYNPTKRRWRRGGGDRYPLVLALSSDGKNWRNILTLESEPGEYSYPAVIQGEGGELHITYTWRRERIKYVLLELQ